MASECAFRQRVEDSRWSVWLFEHSVRPSSRGAALGECVPQVSGGTVRMLRDLMHSRSSEGNRMDYVWSTPPNWIMPIALYAYANTLP